MSLTNENLLAIFQFLDAKIEPLKKEFHTIRVDLIENIIINYNYKLRCKVY